MAFVTVPSWWPLLLTFQDFQCVAEEACQMQALKFLSFSLPISDELTKQSNLHGSVLPSVAA